MINFNFEVYLVKFSSAMQGKLPRLFIYLLTNLNRLVSYI